MVHSGDGPENLAARTSGTVEDLFNQFYKEKTAFDASNYRAKFQSGSYNGQVIGHYSQIVWADNTKVGCGLTDCRPNYYKYYLVCRYATGNIIGREVYALSSSTTTKKTTTTTKKTTTTTTKKTTSLPTNSTEKCGPGIAICASGLCCSKYGYCGTTTTVTINNIKDIVKKII